MRMIFKKYRELQILIYRKLDAPRIAIVDIGRFYFR